MFRAFGSIDTVALTFRDEAVNEMTPQVTAKHSTSTNNPRFLVDSRLEEGFFKLLLAARDLDQRCEPIMKEHGLIMSHLQLMDIVRRHPTMTMKQITLAMALDKPSVFRLLQPLLANDWLEKHHDPQDKRVRHLRLTGTGEHMFNQVMDRIRQMMRSVYQQSELDQVSGFEAILWKLLSSESQNLFPQALPHSVPRKAMHDIGR